MKIFVCGDIHGCIEEVAELANTVGYSKGRDRFIFAGDLIDRGPDPAAVINFAQGLGAEVLMGNHEEKAIRWLKHDAKRQEVPGYRNLMAEQHPDRLAQWRAISDRNWKWLDSRPKYIHVNDWWTAVHGGCAPGIPVEQQDNNVLMRMRYWDDHKKKMVSPTPKGDRPDSCHHWSDVWDGERKIVYGHYTFDTPKITHNTLGIDTGCYSGGFLTAAEFNTDNDSYVLHQVRAKRVYHPRRWGNDSVD